MTLTDGTDKAYYGIALLSKDRCFRQLLKSPDDQIDSEGRDDSDPRTVAAVRRVTSALLHGTLFRFVADDMILIVEETRVDLVDDLEKGTGVSSEKSMG